MIFHFSLLEVFHRFGFFGIKLSHMQMLQVCYAVSPPLTHTILVAKLVRAKEKKGEKKNHHGIIKKISLDLSIQRLNIAKVAFKKKGQVLLS